MTLLEKRKLLYDGVETQELYATTFCVNDHCFKLAEIISTEFKDLKDTISTTNVLKIASVSEFETKANSKFLKSFKDYDFKGFDCKDYDSFLNIYPEFYKSKEGLSVYYLIKDDLLFIFSFGEKQPGRYMLFLECLWDLKKLIVAVYDFAYVEAELNAYKLKLLFNIEDLNNAIFDTVFDSLKPHQQEQYQLFKWSSEALNYRKERNAALPEIDFNNLPEELDAVLLGNIMLYQKEGAIRSAIEDALSEKHKTQITRFEWEKYEEEKARKRALMTDGEIRKEKEWWDNYNADPTPRFFGNMGEPDTVEGYIAKYAVDPQTGEIPSVERYIAKYGVDPKTGRAPENDNDKGENNR